jgi:hypothetical protein
MNRKHVPPTPLLGAHQEWHAALNQPFSCPCGELTPGRSKQAKGRQKESDCPVSSFL